MQYLQETSLKPILALKYDLNLDNQLDHTLYFCPKIIYNSYRIYITREINEHARKGTLSEVGNRIIDLFPPEMRKAEVWSCDAYETRHSS